MAAASDAKGEPLIQIPRDPFNKQVSFDSECFIRQITSAKEVTRFGATAELVVTQLGSGILLLPGAFLKAGIIPSLVVLLAVGMTASNRAALLAECIEKCTDKTHQPSSFVDVARRALGDRGEVAVSISISGTLYCCCLAFLILIGNLLADICAFPGTTMLVSEISWKAMVTIALLLASFLGGMAELQWVGIAGSLATVLTAACIISAAIQEIHEHRPTQLLNTHVSDVISSITTFGYCYGAIQTMPMIARDMASRSQDLVPAVHNAHIFSTLIFLVVGLIGYIGFGDAMRPQALDSLKDSYNTLWYLGSIGIIFHLVLAVPVLMNMVARSIEQRMQRKRWIEVLCRSVLMLGLFLLSCTPIAIFSDFVGIVPATTVTLNCFVWPSIVYWGLMHSEHGSFFLAARHAPRRLMADMVIAVLALIAMVFGTRSAILQLLSDLRNK